MHCREQMFSDKYKTIVIMQKLFLVILFSIIFLISGCAPIILGLYGMKKPKEVEEKDIYKYAKKYKVPLSDCYELDTTFISYLGSFEKNKFNNQVKNHSQPLQALYYDKSGQLKSFQINCNAGGFPNLKWNRNGIFETFPPKLQALTDSILPLSEHLKYINSLSKSTTYNTGDYDYIVLVHWNRFMGRQSKRLIRYVKNNTKLTDKKTKVIYINSDDIFKTLDY